MFLLVNILLIYLIKLSNPFIFIDSLFTRHVIFLAFHLILKTYTNLMEVIKVEYNINIPKGDENVVVNLTVKEILSLSGDNFVYDKEVLAQAKKKIKQQLKQGS